MEYPKLFGSAHATLAEGPMWSSGDQCFYWFDVEGRQLFRQPISEQPTRILPLPRMPGSFGWRTGGGMIFAFRNGLALSDAPGQDFREIACDGIDFATERFNDGAVDSRGRFWVGSFHPRTQPNGGCLYRIDPDLSVHRMVRDMTMSNGLAWSPDDRTMYAADSRPGCVWAFDFDAASGTIGNRRPFIDYAERPGRPDGLTVDAEGFLWIAEVAAGRVARYDPDGGFDRAIPMPVTHPTSVTFGGEDYRTLLITSMSLGIGEADLATQPDAGRAFLVTCETPGRPEHVFAG